MMRRGIKRGFRFPPVTLYTPSRHPMPDNDITFRGFSVGISALHKVEWPYRCNIRSWAWVNASTRSSLETDRVVTFPFLTSLVGVISPSREGRMAIFIESDLLWTCLLPLLLRRIGFVRYNIAIHVGNYRSEARDFILEYERNKFPRLSCNGCLSL